MTIFPCLSGTVCPKSRHVLGTQKLLESLNLLACSDILSGPLVKDKNPFVSPELLELMVGSPLRGACELSLVS